MTEKRAFQEEAVAKNLLRDQWRETGCEKEERREGQNQRVIVALKHWNSHSGKGVLIKIAKAGDTSYSSILISR